MTHSIEIFKKYLLIQRLFTEVLSGLREPTNNTESPIHSQQQEDNITCRSHGQVQQTELPEFS